MTEVTLFQTGFRMDDSALQVGDIFRKADGTIWLVNPDSSQTQIGSGVAPDSVTAEDINSESSSAGEVLTSNGDGTASWATPGGGGTDGILVTTMNNVPILGVLAEKLVADFSQGLGSTMTTTPLIYAASGLIGFEIDVLNVPDLSDTLDINYSVFFTDQLGTNSGVVSGSASTSTPISSYSVDFTGTSATIVGVDLSWDDTQARFTSAAGGVYTALIFVSTSPD